MSELIMSPESSKPLVRTAGTPMIRKEEQKKISKAQGDKIVAAEKERDREMVTGMYTNKEKRGGKLEFMFFKYAEDGPMKYTFEDGKLYRIPRMIAKHLNNNCFYKEYTAAKGFLGNEGYQAAATGTESTSSRMYAVNKVRRAEFRSLEFMEDDLTPNTQLTEIVSL